MVMITCIKYDFFRLPCLSLWLIFVLFMCLIYTYITPFENYVALVFDQNM